MREILLYALLPVLVILILKKPFAGLLLYTGVNIVRPEMFFWGGDTGAMVFKLFISATMLSLFLNYKDNLLKPLSVREVWLILWIWIAIIISLQITSLPVHPKAYYYAEEFVKLFVLSWIIVCLLNTESKIIAYEKLILILFMMLALWGVEQHFRGNARLEGLGGNAGTDSNGVAAAFVLALPLGLNMVLHFENKRQQWLGILSSLVIVFAIVSTQSRGGLIGFGVSFLLFSLRTSHKKKMIMVSMVILIAASLFASDEYLNRMSTITAEKDERDFSAASRPVLWKAGLMVFRDHPLTGTGFLSFSEAKMPYRDAVENVDEELRAYCFQNFKVGHNTYIQALAEGGALLFIPFAWLILGTFWNNQKVRSTSHHTAKHPLLNLVDAIEAGIAGYCVCIIFIDALTSILLPIQILVARAIREELTRQQTAQATPEPIIDARVQS